MSSSSLKKNPFILFFKNVSFCVHMCSCMVMWEGMCVSWCACAGPEGDSVVGSHCPPCLRQGLFLVAAVYSRLTGP